MKSAQVLHGKFRTERRNDIVKKISARSSEYYVIHIKKKVGSVVAMVINEKGVIRT